MGDERMRVLAAIREEEEERQRAEIERKAKSGVQASDAQISAENANSDVASTEPLLAPADEENNAVQDPSARVQKLPQQKIRGALRRTRRNKKQTWIASLLRMASMGSTPSDAVLCDLAFFHCTSQRKEA